MKALTSAQNADNISSSIYNQFLNLESTLANKMQTQLVETKDICSLDQSASNEIADCGLVSALKRFQEYYSAGENATTNYAKTISFVLVIEMIRLNLRSCIDIYSQNFAILSLFFFYPNRMETNMNSYVIMEHWQCWDCFGCYAVS